MIIETKRLILRPFRESDANDVYEYLKEPAVNCFSCMKINSLDAAKAETRERSKKTEYTIAIVLKENNKVIGEIDSEPEAAFSDKDLSIEDTFSPCWMLNKEYHGKGYAYEAVHAFFDYLFNEKKHGVYTYTPRTITFHASGSVKDSESCGKLSVSSTKNLVTVRVFHGSKIK